MLLGATLALRRGEIGVLLGGNGAGKSTLLRAAAGLWPAARGVVRSPAEGGLDPRSCALLLEDPAAQFVTSTAAEEIAFTLENADLPREEIARRVDDTLREFDLEAFAGRDPLTMSPGEQERLLVAAALALRPALLLLDDPFLYLGPGEGRMIWTRLREAVDRGHVQAVLLAAHDGELAAEADVAGVLDRGTSPRLGAARRGASNGASRVYRAASGSARGAPAPRSRVDRRRRGVLRGARWPAGSLRRWRHEARRADLSLSGTRIPSASARSPSRAPTTGPGSCSALRDRERARCFDCSAARFAPPRGSVRGRASEGSAAYLPQLPERALAGRNLAEDLCGDARPTLSRRTELRTVLKAVDLAGAGLSRPSRTLSAGERRRAAIALLLLSGHDHWALDEPDAALDAGGVDRVVALLRESELFPAGVGSG